MSKRNGIMMVSLIVVTVCNAFGMAKPVKGQRPTVSVGVFDSRAVACAWIRSKEHMKQLGEMRAEYEKAKANSDEKRVSELEKQSPESQEVAHRQVFGNEPIDDVLKRIEKDLPGIAKSAGVDMLVSKWEIAYQKKSVKFVDVTWEMAELFEPDAETVKVIKSLLKQKPVPAEELKHDH